MWFIQQSFTASFCSNSKRLHVCEQEQISNARCHALWYVMTLAHIYAHAMTIHNFGCDRYFWCGKNYRSGLGALNTYNVVVIVK